MWVAVSGLEQGCSGMNLSQGQTLGTRTNNAIGSKRMKYKAYVTADFEVEFEDDGDVDLTDLASEAVDDVLNLKTDVYGYEIKEINKSNE